MEFLRTGTKSRDKTIRKYRPEIKSFFDNQTLRIVERFNEFYRLKSFKAAIEPKDLDVLINYLLPKGQEDALLKQTMKPLHTSATQKAIDDINDIAEAGVVSSLSNARVVAAIASMGAKITEINDTTRAIIRDILDQAITDGTNIYDIAAEIQATGLDEWYANRSLAIARTETRMAYDVGGGIAYSDLGAETFSVVGCIGVLAPGFDNGFGYYATYGEDAKEEIGSCGCTVMPISIWDDVSGVHHPNHLGVMVADKIK